jgi:hypothetical protein
MMETPASHQHGQKHRQHLLLYFPPPWFDLSHHGQALLHPLKIYPIQKLREYACYSSPRSDRFVGELNSCLIFTQGFLTISSLHFSVLLSFLLSISKKGALFLSYCNHFLVRTVPNAQSGLNVRIAGIPQTH